MLIVSFDVLKPCKVYTVVGAELLFLLDLIELSTVALGAATFANHTENLTLTVTVDLLEKRGVTGRYPNFSSRATGVSCGVMCTTPCACPVIELAIGEVSSVGALTST